MAQKISPLFLVIMTLSLPVAAAPSPPGGSISTVNTYTPAQEGEARKAATQAGFTPGPVLFAQAGNFFFNASKGGQSYSLTVTPDGQVYASTSTK